jgi:RNA polymerase sigma-70 factor (ECF subfamily)
MSEAELVAAARSGDEAAFEALMRGSLRKVLGVALKILRNEAEAWDAAQDAFVKAWRKIGEFRGEAAFSTWVCGIATRSALDRIRAGKNEGAASTLSGTSGDEDAASDDLAKLAADSNGPEANAESAALGREIARALEELPEAERAVFLLHEENGMKYREIADALEIPIGTVMSRLHSARLKLQRILEPWWHRQTPTSVSAAVPLPILSRKEKRT